MVSVTKQLSLDIIEDSTPRPKPINVASVPQLSPFRYPGGKTWFVPRFRQWIQSQPARPKLLVEPFAGGGIISLTAAAESLCDEVVMVELDAQVAAVWQTILSDDADWLINRIIRFEMTLENARRVLEDHYKETRDVAFQTIIKNRTVHGGILASGSGLLKHGENGKGVSSRWYPQTLARRIQQIHLIRHRIKFLHDDAFSVFNKYKNQKALFFIDPPYSIPGSKSAGSRLYTYWKIDHEKLFSICGGLQGSFVLTYDNAEEVVTLANQHGFQHRQIAMKNTHHAEMSELAISKDMSWLI
ncbi:DNA adenine methylase [Ereboglobus sp. PH5-10]|uniref:DNA adenine methylase n=1 Tax=Ereboglobus sp. PH5-10 TaxID=2940629 RepID=UPI002406648F|nr:DNA adenine methylase [Ereboglobus sp. PH5-10]MDF9827302.1 DNA adenine methylase [Ereboglobus sp. PH5-10]